MASLEQLRKKAEASSARMKKANVDVSITLEEMLIEKAFGETITQELMDKFTMMHNAYMDELSEFTIHSNAYIERLAKELDDEKKKNGK